MALTPSTLEMTLGDLAPGFRLSTADETWVELHEFQGKNGILVMFICNHCPFVKHIQAPLSQLCTEYQEKGIGIVGINSNDIEKYPDDSPEKMYAESKSAGYTFPYLFDESQAVAKDYKAACTPDFFLFDSKFQLYYAGQFDSSLPENGIAVTGEDLRKAMDTLLEEKPLDFKPTPSVGCNIKWKPGNEPPYFG
jgi:peroxiredoxin